MGSAYVSHSEHSFTWWSELFGFVAVGEVRNTKHEVL